MVSLKLFKMLFSSWFISSKETEMLWQRRLLNLWKCFSKMISRKPNLGKYFTLMLKTSLYCCSVSLSMTEQKRLGTDSTATIVKINVKDFIYRYHKEHSNLEDLHCYVSVSVFGGPSVSTYKQLSFQKTPGATVLLLSRIFCNTYCRYKESLALDSGSRHDTTLITSL